MRKITRKFLYLAGLGALVGAGAGIFGYLNQREKPIEDEKSPEEIWGEALEKVSEKEMERLRKEYFEKYGVKPALPERLPANDIETSRLVGLAIKHGIPKEKFDEMEESLNDVRYPNGPTSFAGELYDNSKVKILERDRNRVLKAEGIGSYYTEDVGETTATGARFKNEKLTVAVNEGLGYELPCLVRVTNQANGKSVEAIANDHGPYMFNRRGKAIRKGRRFIPHDKRIVDASPRVAEILGYKNKGTAKVLVEYLGSL